MSIDYTDYELIDHPRTIARFVIAMTIVALLFTLAAAMPSTTAEPSSVSGVSEHCKSAACLSPAQLMTPSEALRMKRRLGSHALLVDVRAKAEAPAGLAMGSDAQIPFMEVVNASGMEFRIDFAEKVDEALRAAHMGHDEPVILMSPSTERSVLAALLLQERGYTDIYVMRP
jgi:rhodanese-related sulfurtransferase